MYRWQSDQYDGDDGKIELRHEADKIDKSTGPEWTEQGHRAKL